MQKANTIEEAYSIFNPDIILQRDDEAFYVDIYGASIKRLVNMLALNQVQNKTFFIAGQTGNGKSTMLNMLTLKHPKIADKYEFHYIVGRKVFLYDDVDIVDVLLMIGNTIINTSESLKAKYIDGLKKLQDIQIGAYEESESTSEKGEMRSGAQAKISIGAKFFSIFGANINLENSYKINEEIRKDARKFFKIKRSELIELTNEIILSYKAEKNNGKDLVIVIDDLEKKDNIDELFIKDMALLNELNIIKIIAMPIHLKRTYTIHSGEVIEFGLKIKTEDEKPNTSDIDLLQMVIDRRIENSSLIDSEAANLAIEYSGANVRQLIRLMANGILRAYDLGANVITKEDIEHAIGEIGLELSPQVMNMASFLNEIATNKKYLDNKEENQAKIAKATKSDLVFAYFNGVVWYDINPVIKTALEQYLK